MERRVILPKPKGERPPESRADMAARTLLEYHRAQLKDATDAEVRAAALGEALEELYSAQVEYDREGDSEKRRGLAQELAELRAQARSVISAFNGEPSPWDRRGEGWSAALEAAVRDAQREVAAALAKNGPYETNREAWGRTLAEFNRRHEEARAKAEVSKSFSDVLARKDLADYFEFQAKAARNAAYMVEQMAAESTEMRSLPEVSAAELVEVAEEDAPSTEWLPRATHVPTNSGERPTELVVTDDLKTEFVPDEPARPAAAPSSLFGRLRAAAGRFAGPIARVAAFLGFAAYPAALGAGDGPEHVARDVRAEEVAPEQPREIIRVPKSGDTVWGTAKSVLAGRGARGTNEASQLLTRIILDDSGLTAATAARMREGVTKLVLTRADAVAARLAAGESVREAARKEGY